jgi:NAD(P)-dependent dehydrogenase (short-subunit alcohol dehydrogenase family)
MTSILITGCDTGLGVEFARQYAADGCRVLATCLDPATAGAARAIDGDVRVMKLDVADLAAIDALADALRGEPIDILVSNAGIGRPHPPFGETDYDLWHRMLDVNLVGPMRLAEAFVEHVAMSEMKVMARGAAGILLSAHRAGGLDSALKAIGAMVVDDLDLVLRGLPAVRLQCAQPETVGLLRSSPGVAGAAPPRDHASPDAESEIH